MKIFNFKNKKNIKSNIIKILKRSLNIFLLLISISILVYFCIEDNNLINLINILSTLNFYWIIAAFCAVILYWYFDSKIFQKISSLIYFKKYNNLFFLKLTLIGQYFTSITPLGIAGQPMQIVEMCKYSIPKNIAIFIMTRKFFIYQSSLAFYSVICGIFYYDTLKSICPELIWMLITGLIFQSTLVILILLFSINKNIILNIIKIIIFSLFKLKIIKDKNKSLKAMEEKLNIFIKSNNYMNKNKKSNIQLYILTFLQITFLLSIPFFVFKSFNHDSFPILEIICTQSIVNTISSFTPFPGAAGTVEKGFITLFTSFFNTFEIGQAMILFRLISFYFSIIVGMVVYKIPFKKSKNIKKEFKRRY